MESTEQTGLVVTSISFERDQVDRLDSLASELRRSRSFLVREAVEQFLGAGSSVSSVAKPAPGPSRRREPKKPSPDREFVAWAIEEVWSAHLLMRDRFFRRENGQAGPPPVLDGNLKKEIERAIRRKDEELVRAGDRDRFQKESWARASGIGLFLDPWCTGADPENDAARDGKRYLEAWRPWKLQRGKGDPIDRFAPLYFARKGAGG